MAFEKHKQRCSLKKRTVQAVEDGVTLVVWSGDEATTWVVFLFGEIAYKQRNYS